MAFELDRQIQTRAQEHLERCHEALFAEEEGSDSVENPATAPFCGCETCVVREILTVTWNDLIASAIIYIEENAKDQEAINGVYRSALRRIANGDGDAVDNAKMALSETKK